jgi:hypothetical protein
MRYEFWHSSDLEACDPARGIFRAYRYVAADE